ncbi:MAG: DsbA family protein [Actinobacteria bacterium]|nr:DsbA family protein [Actinomycetota bacterium]
MIRVFSITYDYLCPFARNANEHVLDGIEAGADWDVSFVPFSLSQVHAGDDGKPDVWEREDPLRSAGIRAMLAGLVVRDQRPDRFLAVHRSLFAARHDDGDDIRDRDVVAGALERAGVDAEEVLGEVDDHAALDVLRKEHEAAVDEHEVFGVPTFIVGDDAVFVRLMHRPEGDAELATTTVERVLDLLTGWTDLNEFKRTSIPR